MCFFLTSPFIELIGLVFPLLRQVVSDNRSTKKWYSAPAISFFIVHLGLLRICLYFRPCHQSLAAVPARQPAVIQGSAFSCCWELCLAGGLTLSLRRPTSVR